MILVDPIIHIMESDVFANVIRIIMIQDMSDKEFKSLMGRIEKNDPHLTSVATAPFVVKKEMQVTDSRTGETRTRESIDSEATGSRIKDFVEALGKNSTITRIDMSNSVCGYREILATLEKAILL